ncbi:hypothetical protein [Sphingomonas astaxanthinifaciens]|uniref:AAA domain-containing protein n=1 Tax=Sphingomonas astaxanthinifaciens DSM 22298 TaxID=1123267 RepID=A0ABQ5Z996_9SPHN|nr:hypothetical protein [Sphingomonas astaxanthinifaciens]GLR48071.1 hypothetical protein GCM10007925_17840 [Sphingomonas astaxanthinifaciens DSM 22298]
MPALILTGASGSGKTSIAEALGRDGLAVFHFDSVGVPSPEAMVGGWGSGEAWQQAMTDQWIERLASHDPQVPILLEGQMRIAFIRKALLRQPHFDARILLIDCDDSTRDHRLIHERGQPGLAHAEMRNWAAFLRREAVAEGVDILDTSGRSVAESASRVRARLRPSQP